MAVNIPKLGDARVYAYTYDQLNRIIAMDAYSGLNSSNAFTPVLLDDYKERISYDANGNIITYQRNGNKAGAQKAMDNLTYNYKNNSNQLIRVRDAVPATNYTEDIDDQPANNYDYDNIGNLIKDVKEGITNITWTVYGKIESIAKTDGTAITYNYDAAGNRIAKAVTKAGNTNTTVYVRDAQGNTLSIYEQNSTLNSGHFTQSELHLYGSSRLGIYNVNKDLTLTPPPPANMGYGNNGGLYIFERGKKFFELTNHLGNVLATVSDEKTGVDLNNDGTIDYYTANVVSANDYYPFGMMMPARTFRGGPGIYRYGFNRQEKSIEIDPNGNSMTAEFWQYDARLGKRWNVDPRLTTGVSPYSAFLNNPILNIDPIGDTTINGQLMEGTNPASAIYLQEIVLKATRHSKVPNLERDFSAAITRDLKALEITPDQLKDKIVGKVLHELLPPLPDAIQKPLDRARQLHKFGKVMTGMHEQGGKSPFPFDRRNYYCIRRRRSMGSQRN